MRYPTTALLLAVVTTMLVVPFIIYGQGVSYTPLEPILEEDITPQGGNFVPYVDAMITIMIYLAAVLAVIMITIGGIEYITSGDSESRVTSAKERIRKAVLGLVLALGSWLILFTINPDLLDFNLNPEEPSGLESPYTTEELAGMNFEYVYRYQYKTDYQTKTFREEGTWNGSDQECQDFLADLISESDAQIKVITSCEKYTKGGFIESLRVTEFVLEWEVLETDTIQDSTSTGRPQCIDKFQDELDDVNKEYDIVNSKIVKECIPIPPVTE